ncbi:hypothetical protein LPW26_06195 [Rhodopseudomonas sp. HC1]|uniref:hypothetical protein n=1 Tax=Rhodopseudomonas infernalis TaxID=2897386 RepID=UPI001EE86F3B|nr:hypothetical protein [Rhodopseudomonas infernalis]MCG6204218.1 hypothetical protein [Rhodopseudomonas infernalis]
MSLSASAHDRSPSRHAGPFALGVLVVAHLGTLWLPFVNQESAFNSAARYFQTGDAALVQAYFESDANTLVLAAVGAALAHVLGISVDWGCRLVSLIGFAVMAAGLHAIVTQARIGGWLISAAIMLNPLIWVFAGRGTADFPPMAFALAAIAICWRAQGPAMVLAGAGVFAFAAALKYHAVLLLPLIALAPTGTQSVKFRGVMLGIVVALTGCVLAVYNVAVFKAFGFWLTAPKWVTEHGLTTQHVLTNVVHYGGFLALLAMPFSLQSTMADPRGRMLKLAAIALAGLVGAVLPSSSGEMNFGPFDRWVGAGVSGVVLAGLFAVFVLSLLNQPHTVRDRAMIGVIALFVVVLSFSRPAQRYLIFMLPFYVVYLSARIEARRFAAVLVALCIALNLVSAVTQIYFRPAASENFGAARRW